MHDKDHAADTWYPGALTPASVTDTVALLRDIAATPDLVNLDIVECESSTMDALQVLRRRFAQIDRDYIVDNDAPDFGDAVDTIGELIGAIGNEIICADEVDVFEFISWAVAFDRYTGDTWVAQLDMDDKDLAAGTRCLRTELTPGGKK